MKIGVVAAALLFASASSRCQNADDISLLVRADDMGSFHDANVACIQACTEGIARSIEVMVPCAWFPEAVRLLNENPSIDVGIHLVLTSEWEGIKWRPLTDVPSLVDQDGYFYPQIWGGKDSARSAYLLKVHWSIQEIEKEMRAQIALAKKCIPRPTLFQPNSRIARKPDSRKKAKVPSMARVCPMTPPAYLEKCDQLVPNWNSIGMPVTTPSAKLTAKMRAQKRAQSL